MSSQILLSRGIAGLDPEQARSELPAASLVTFLENPTIHILSIGPSIPSDITRYAGTPAAQETLHSSFNNDSNTEVRITGTLATPRRPRNHQRTSIQLEAPQPPPMSATLADQIDTDAPLRSNASPRSTPTASKQSSFSYRLSSGHLSPNEVPSAEQSPTRGRTLVRTPAHERRRARSTAGRLTGLRPVDFDNTFMQQRLMSKDLTAEPDEMFDSIREPLPVGVERFPGSLSEELYKAATWGTEIDVSRFGDHRDTFAILGLRQLQDRRLALPSAFFDHVLPYIDFATYLAIRLSCRCWSASITRARPISWPSVSMLPAEVLENVLARLDPVDFDAARHTCRAWMIASLEERLLAKMLKIGGWWGAAMADMQLLEDRGEQSRVDTVNREWLQSKRLATECSLRPDWTGNGALESASLVSFGHSTSMTGLKITSETDFSELSNSYSPFNNTGHGAALHFTVSVCNKFLMAAEGCVIYIYSLRDNSSASHEYGGHLSPFTTLVCPHRVLAVSMDTSSGRFAIAALLESRVGMVCDLHEGTLNPQCQSRSRTLHSTTRDFRSTPYSPSSSGERIMTEGAPPYVYDTSHDELTDFRGSYPSDRARAQATAEGILPESNGARSSPTSWTIDDPLTAMSAASGASLSGPITGFLSIQGGSRSIYRNLCSAEDPPRSVAICPQRRCVAFGCSAGIELHWIDALTGQDLNRWFPLTTPSDFLYFLPPRPGVDSAKKLRLISSACHSKEKNGLQGRFFPGNAEARYHGMSWDEGITDTAAWNNAWRGGGWCDHCRAVPVSDGWNVLFTDPEKGTLSLGSDAPPGAGATKLVRRFVLVGPTDENGGAIVPRVYASGGELRWGVRIVAGYGDAIWLFVVPPDDFPTVDKKPDNQDAGVHEGTETGDNTSVRIEGKEIGKVPGLVDVAVDSTAGNLTVWAFAADGMAYVWQMEGRLQPISKRVILQDGFIVPVDDEGGDTFMHNYSTRAVHFDGTTSARPSPPAPYAPQDHIIDSDGDVAMPDADYDEGYASGNDEFTQAGGIFAIHAPPIWGSWSEDDAGWVPEYLRSHGEGIEDRGLGIDLLELTRLDVEVLGG